MAIKPTTTFTFATDPTFTGGPAAGQPVVVPPPIPAQGFVPGDAIAAEYVNYLENVTGQWITDWLSLGSNVGTLDAHIVETDGTGRAGMSAAQIGGTASAVQPVEVRNNLGAPAAATIDHVTGGPALALTAASGPALTVSAASGLGVTGTSGDSIGGLFFGGGASIGLAGVGGAGGGAGVFGLGQGLGAGGVFFAGPTGPGVIGQVGAVGGPALEAAYLGAPAAPLRGMLFLAPTLQPAAPVDGDIWKITGVTGGGRGGIEFQDLDGSPGGGAPGKQRVWSTENGLGYGYAANDAAADENAGVSTVRTTLTLGFAASPGDPPGRYIVEWQCRVHVIAGDSPTARAEVTFAHPGGTEVYEQNFSATNERKGIGGFVEFVLPVAGTGTFTISWRTLDTPNTIRIESARIVARGAYE